MEELEGRLFVYYKNLTAFESGGANHKLGIIFLGGLQDGFMTVKYLRSLSDHLKQRDIPLYQLLLSSSYSGYGVTSLKSDAQELSEFFKHNLCEEYILFGHSTGCQIILTFLKHFLPPSSPSSQYPIRGAILQGGVSDSDYRTYCGQTTFIAEAEQLINSGHADVLLPYNADDVPISAYRYFSLSSPLGDDEMFPASFNLPPQNIDVFETSVPLAIILSGSDEYIPPGVSVERLCERYATIPSVRVAAVISDADHAISQSHSIPRFLNEVDASISAFTSSLS